MAGTNTTWQENTKWEGITTDLEEYNGKNNIQSELVVLYENLK